MACSVYKRSASDTTFTLSPLPLTYDNYNCNKIPKTMPRPTPTKPKPTPKPNNIFAFHSFGEPGRPASFSGAFRDNVRDFLAHWAQTLAHEVEGNPAWLVYLALSQETLIPLYVVEEHVRNSPWPYCDHCRCVGWSHHLVSRRRYHFIIPASDQSHHLLPSRLVLDRRTHLLHGLIHCSGFGHLLSLNGHENGSKHLSGHHTMDLWDRICSMLCTRKVTVEDTARKHSMELRLLHSAAYGHPWFWRWGYSFFHGSFGISENRYSMAVKILNQLPLDMLDPEHQDPHLHRIFGAYNTTCNSEISTLGELLHTMLQLKARLPWQKADAAPPITGSRLVTSSKCLLKKHHNHKAVVGVEELAASSQCRWSPKRFEVAARVVAEILEASGSRRMLRQEVRDAARGRIGDTGLLDFVLKSLNNCAVGPHLIRRTVNPKTKVLEYSLSSLSSTELDNWDGEAATENRKYESGDHPQNQLQVGRRSEIERDLEYVYRRVLEGGLGGKVVEAARRVVLDTKHFTKEWPIRDADEQLRFMVSVVVAEDEAGMFSRAIPPPELVVVPLHATVGDLRAEAEHAFRDTYCIMEGFAAEDLIWPHGQEISESELLFGVAESGMGVWVRGRGAERGEERLRYEGGAEEWRVECECGARDDDGERMVACDVCEVWQHTRCLGIADAEAVPQLFFCARCGSALLPPDMLPHEPLIE
ncbi:hypothetical protein AMTRI_Chr04g244420 [Amborella trichopoda]